MVFFAGFSCASYRGLDLSQTCTTFTLIEQISTYVYENLTNFDKRSLGFLRTYVYLGLDIESETSNNTIK